MVLQNLIYRVFDYVIYTYFSAFICLVYVNSYYRDNYLPVQYSSYLGQTSETYS